MQNLYTAAVYVQSNIHDQPSKMITMAIVATSEAEAMGIAYASAERDYPAQSGYGTPSVVVSGIHPDKILTAAQSLEAYMSETREKLNRD